MMVNVHTPVVAALALLIGTTPIARAQDAVPDFTQLQALTRPGDAVHLTDTMGRRTTWTLRDLPLERLIQQAGLTAPEVRTVAIERADPLWNGMLIGLAAAGLPWLIVCAQNDWCYYNEYGAENMLRTTAVMTTAIGAGIGALVDRSIRKRTTIFESTGTRPLKLGLSPALSTSGVAVRLSAGF